MSSTFLPSKEPALDAGKPFVLLQCNDVYQVEVIEGKAGGLAPLYTLVQKERRRAAMKYGEDCPVLFVVCGDFLSASHLGEVYQGAHMVDMFNEMGVDYVVFGNHEFDFGNDVLRKRVKESKFKWIGTNVLEIDNKTHFSNSYGNDVVQGGNGIRIGLFGCCTLATKNLSFPDKDVIFSPIIPAARSAVHTLRNEQECDVVIALNHLSLHEDKLMAREVEGIDVILGGHDHVPVTLFQEGTFIHKSGESATHLMRLEGFVQTKSDDTSHKISYQWKMILNRGYSLHEVVNNTHSKYTAALDESNKEVLCTLTTSLDSRNTRCKETTMCNIVVDTLYKAFSPYGVHIVIINGGFIRGNRLYPIGHSFTRGDLMMEFPFPKMCVMVKLTGKRVIECIEAGLRAVEHNAGFFPHVAGLKYTYSMDAPPLGRVVSVSLPDGSPILPDTLYNVIVTEYLLGGGDGYPLAGTHAMPTPLQSILISQILADHFIKEGKVGACIDGRITAL